MITWISTEERLPKEGVDVLIYDGTFKVGKIELGISEAQRQAMKRGELHNPLRALWRAASGYELFRRSDIYTFADEGERNKKPYAWTSGVYQIYGQDVEYWAELNPPEGVK